MKIEVVCRDNGPQRDIADINKKLQERFLKIKERNPVGFP